MTKASDAALAAWRELNDRQQGTLSVIYNMDQENEEYRKREAARGNWDNTPAAEWRRIDFAHEPSDRRAFGTTELQNRLGYRGWDNQGNGSTMAALAERKLIRRSSRGTTFGLMHMVTITREGRAAAKAGTSIAPTRAKKPALSQRSWEVLAMLWAHGLRGGVLKWISSPTIDKVLIGKHIPPLAERLVNGYTITDRGRWFYAEHYASHVAAYPDVRALHPDGAAAEPWPAEADAILKAHHLRHRALCSAWQDAYAARQAAEAEAGTAVPASPAALPATDAAQVAGRHLLWVETARQRADFAAQQVDDLGERIERAAREFAAAALAAFAAAVSGTDPLLTVRPPSDADGDAWDEPPLPPPPGPTSTGSTPMRRSCTPRRWVSRCGVAGQPRSIAAGLRCLNGRRSRVLRSLHWPGSCIATSAPGRSGDGFTAAERCRFQGWSGCAAGT